MILGSRDVGVIGVGDLGAAITRRLLSVGFTVWVYDTKPGAVDASVRLGAIAATSLTELSERCRVVSVVVFDDDGVKQVGLSLAPLMRSGGVIVVQSSVLPTTLLQLADYARGFGVEVVDAAVTGGSERADRGSLTLLIGGSAPAVATIMPFLKALGENRFHLGGVGAGVAAKVVHNLLSIGSYAVQLEAMRLAQLYGLSEEAVTSIAAHGQADARGLRTWGRLDRFRRDRLTEHSRSSVYNYMTKDVRSAILMGEAGGVALPLAQHVADLLPEMLVARDTELDGAGFEGPPRCSNCGQELAAPFRSIGQHPECSIPRA